MEKKEALNVIRGVAEPLGYQFRSAYFWRYLDDIAVMFQLDKPRWNDGHLVRIGLLPKRFITNPKPPHSGHWGICIDPDDIPDCPHVKFFESLAYDEDIEIPAQELEEPIRWVFNWTMRYWDSVEAVRASVLDEKSFFATRRMLWIKDWANGELKDQEEYRKPRNEIDTSASRVSINPNIFRFGDLSE